jgi:hypothetical protein
MMYEVIVCRCMVSLSTTKKMNKLFCPMEDNVGTNCEIPQLGPHYDDGSQTSRVTLALFGQ